MIKSKRFVMLMACTIILMLMLSFVSCESPVENYDVTGTWVAEATWHEDNPYNYGGDNYKLTILWEFKSDNTMRIKQTIKLNNNITVVDTGWIIFNGTYSVKGNTIVLSTGKEYVIVDDVFNDIFPDPKLVLTYSKQ